MLSAALCACQESVRSCAAIIIVPVCVLGEKQSPSMQALRIKVTDTQGVCMYFENQSTCAHTDNQMPWSAGGAGLHSCPVLVVGPLEHHRLIRPNAVAVRNKKQRLHVHDPRDKFTGTQFGLKHVSRIRISGFQRKLGYTTILCWQEACLHRGSCRPYAVAAGCLGRGCVL